MKEIIKKIKAILFSLSIEERKRIKSIEVKNTAFLCSESNKVNYFNVVPDIKIKFYEKEKYK